jgi:hypothetical protein
VTSRKQDQHGVPVGTGNKHPILNTLVYTVEFPNGKVREYAANVITENMYSQCDSDGNQFLLLEAIVDHCTDGHAIGKADMYVYSNG